MSINFDFASIKERITGLAQAGVATGKKAAAVAKLKSDNLAQQDALRKAYTAIGKAYYAAHKGNPEEGYEELFAKADAAIAAIVANNAALEELKVKDEVVVDDVDADDVVAEAVETAEVTEADFAEEAVEAVTEKAEEVKETVAEVTEDVVADVKETVEDVVADVKETIAEVTDDKPEE